MHFVLYTKCNANSISMHNLMYYKVTGKGLTGTHCAVTYTRELELLWDLTL